jgi:cell wall-associated NlpC family hydrolase
LVAYVYREGAGLVLPRNTFDLSHLGEPIERTALRPGDLVFYNTQRREYSHVGIYLGEDRFIHAPSSGGEVRVESLRADYWVRRYNGARRVITPPG